MLEIEKKFLLKEVPNDIDSLEKQEILQGYFKKSQNNIRIRKTISYKNKKKQSSYTMTQKKGNGLVRQEEEKEISEGLFLENRELAKPYQIKKTRYLYQYKQRKIEINQFHDKLEGLRMAEVEFPSIKESEEFAPPSRLGQEVTNHKEAENIYLASYGLDKLIRKTNHKQTLTMFQLKNFYNQEAKKYSQTRKKHWNDADIIIKEISKHPNNKISIIEIGCGSGRLLQHLSTINNKEIIYTGVDISEKLLEEAKKITTKNNIKTNFVCKDMVGYLALCKQEEYDIIIGIASFQHLPDSKQRFLCGKYIYRCLNYGGIILMTNRSFSLRMIKKNRKSIIISLINKITNRSQNERNNIIIPWKSNGIIYKRFYHLFTLKELKNIFSQSGFVIKKLCYLTKEGQEIKQRKNSNNTIIVAEKSVLK